LLPIIKKGLAKLSAASEQKQHEQHWDRNAQQPQQDPTYFTLLPSVIQHPVQAGRVLRDISRRIGHKQSLTTLRYAMNDCGCDPVPGLLLHGPVRGLPHFLSDLACEALFHQQGLRALLGISAALR
jgi:hypothetical protein